jgi:hypothetical protein
MASFKPEPARKKPASGSEPVAQNTTGIVIPKTSPNAPGAPTNPPVKAETPQEKSLLEKAGELLEKGEIPILNQAKEALKGGATSLLGTGIVGQIGAGAIEVLFPTNVIDIIPGGKIVSGGKKAAKLGETALKGVGKEAAEKATKEAAEKAAKEAAEKAAKEAAEKEAKAAAGNSGAHSKGTPKKKNPNPCSHPNDSKKKKYVIYKADEFDQQGNKIGTYVGRTSGPPGESTQSILRRRRSGHHRKGLASQLEPMFETDSYAGARGAEHLLREKHSTADQINPIGPKNPRKEDYIDCAKSKGIK